MAGAHPATGRAAVRKVAVPDPIAPEPETQPQRAGPSRRLRNAGLLVFACLALALAIRPIFEAVTQSFRPPAPAASTPSERPLAPALPPAPIPAPAATPAPPPPLQPIRVFTQLRSWGYGDVIGETVTGATCTLDARFEDGKPIPASGLSEPRIAGRDGLVSWYYTPPFAGVNDNGTYVLTCTRDGLSDTSTRDFELGST